jgi:hypothetical protein
VARLAPEPGRLGSAAFVAGFPFGGALGRASLTAGSLEDLRGPSGEATLDRYALPFEPGDVGGPILTPDGAVAGMLVAPDGGSQRMLPPGVALGVDAGRLGAILDEAGIAADRASPIPASGGRAEAEAEVAVLVTCHE